MCDLIITRLTTRRSAISALLKPSAIRARTSVSHGVRFSGSSTSGTSEPAEPTPVDPGPWKRTEGVGGLVRAEYYGDLVRTGAWASPRGSVGAGASGAPG